MSEIKEDLIIFTNDKTGERFEIITESHSISDVLRHIIKDIKTI